MSKCKHLIDISPYDPLCDHPCRLYGGGAVEAECETCQYRIEDLERENAKLRKLCAEMYPYAKAYLQEWRIVGYIDSKSYDWFLQLRKLGVEVDG